MDVSIKKYKKDMFYSYVIGVYGTLELLTTKPESVIKVFISSKGDANKGIVKIREICKKLNIKTEIADGLINKISNNENTYAIGAFRKFNSGIDSNSSHVVLVNPSDMGNVGSIIRSMVGFGVDNLALIRPAIDIFDPKVVRASQGSIFQIKYEYFDNFNQYKASYASAPNNFSTSDVDKAKYNRELYTFTLHSENKLQDNKFEKPFSLIFGNEGAGLGEEFNRVGTSVKIPHNEKIDSLNLSVAVGIVLYEASK